MCVDRGNGHAPCLADPVQHRERLPTSFRAHSLTDGVEVDHAGLQQSLGDFNTQGLKITDGRIAYSLLESPRDVRQKGLESSGEIGATPPALPDKKQQ